MMRIGPFIGGATVLVAGAFAFARPSPPQPTRFDSAQDDQPAVACRADAETNRAYKRKLWDGYEISLGPAANSKGDGDQCTAAIYNKLGHVVYRTTGFNVTFDETLTGRDFDGDAHPEVVFQTDTGGGNSCCWSYNVISLFPKPHRLFDIAADGAVEFEKDAQGKMIIWTRVEAPDVFSVPMAGRPFAERVFRVRDGKMVDSTPDFCARIFSDQNRDFKEWSANLTPENLRQFQSVAQLGDDEENVGRLLLARAFQHVLCRQFDAALADLNLWPAASREKTKASFADFIKGDFPGFAARLVQAAPTR
jgi:hypothetical protein